MARRRPPAVTTMGILNIIWGSLGLLFGCCAGFSLYLAVPPRPSGNQWIPSLTDILRDQTDYVQRELPLYIPYIVVAPFVSLGMAGVLLAAGIGLLNRQNWARLASMGYAVLNTMLLLGNLIFNVFFLMPASQRWQDDFNRRHAQLATNSFNNLGVNQITLVLFAFVCVAYAVVLLIMMLQPGVVAWFERRPKFDRDDDEDDDRPFRRQAEDEEDDDRRYRR